jgi:hypothetical protein
LAEAFFGVFGLLALGVFGLAAFGAFTLVAFFLGASFFSPAGFFSLYKKRKSAQL